ncbi:MAG: insulinase family protein [Trichlorobacter sp.]|uniref:M16 family metallopeptidase n=1 Tax=Trichlorobacter sp. TaxID=2911007 RepID=UPI00255EFD94|nr:pitrilysin family protein [Trichlorobacter sp.]MDK9716367.1 insulinase family protein [Trichlorobacter sp.]
MKRPSCTTLANGLRVVTVELPHLHSADVAVYLKVGGRNDPAGRTGLSHFLEHMLFRGTAEYASSLEIEAAFESLGGGINAATDADSTCYYGRIHPRYATQGLEILASMLLRPRLEGIELERRIIGEEALEDISQDGDEISPDLVVGRMLWPDHPLGESTVGSLEDIARITEQDLYQHLATWYRPNNAVVVAAGPVQHSLIVEATERFMGSWQGAEVPAIQPVVTPLGAGPSCRFVRDSDSQITMQLAFRSCHRAAPELTTLKLLRRILAGGGCSRLHLALRERLGLIYSVDASIGSYDETGCLSIDLSTAPENLATVLKATLEELRLLAASPVPEAELERVRTVYLADLDYSRDSVSEMGIRFGWGTLMGVSRSIDDDQQLVAQVSAAELQGLAAELFRPENRFLGVIGPIESIDQQEIAQLLQF